MQYRFKILSAFSLGIILAGLYVLPSVVQAQPGKVDTMLVKILGTGENARYEPSHLEINPGDVIRFQVQEGIHTVTAYHPDNRRAQRIPEKAESFDSGPLQTGSVWFLQLKKEGVYNYFCRPHEQLGHVGRTIVGSAETGSNHAGTQ